MYLDRLGISLVTFFFFFGGGGGGGGPGVGATSGVY